MSLAATVATPASVVRIDRLEVVRLAPGHWRLDDDAGGACFRVIHVVRGGSRWEPGPTLLEAGELAVISERGRILIDVAPDTELIIVRIPEAAAGTHIHAIRGAVGRVIPSEQGTSGFVAHLLRGLAAHGETNADHAIRLAQHVVGLIGLMCLDVHDDDAWRSTMLCEAVDYIEEHLGELDLTPDRIAAAQNISTRTLHRLFEREGMTLGAWIRIRRLEHCRAELVDPRHHSTSVSAIGARWGLWDAAHFSRLFKATFGASPRAYRQAVVDHREIEPSLRRSA